MIPSPFSIARRYAAHRASFAIDCKINLPFRTDEAELVDTALGLFAVPYFPARLNERCWAKMLKSSPFRARISGGGWTNGFCILADPIATIRSIREIEFPQRDAFMSPGERVEFGCLVYYLKAQDSPVVALSSGRVRMLLDTRNIDAMFTRLESFTDEVTLFFDKGHTGVVFMAYDVSVAYLARLRMPKLMESAILAYAGRFYENCRHRPKPE